MLGDSMHDKCLECTAMVDGTLTVILSQVFREDAVRALTLYHVFRVKWNHKIKVGHHLAHPETPIERE